jgi:V/A-type H+/Na+-transporting ATPase subunit D
MSRRLPLTRLELKRQREALARYERFLPALKRKQQQLQISLLDVDAARRRVADRLAAGWAAVRSYRSVLHDLAGANLVELASPVKVMTSESNVAGVRVPVFTDVVFRDAGYSLFGTPPWVDRALSDLRGLTRCRVELSVLNRQRELLSRELTRIVQRVNLFEKVLIPASRDATRRIRIHLGDQMTAGVGRAKMAKSKLETLDMVHAPAAAAPAGGRP